MDLKQTIGKKFHSSIDYFFKLALKHTNNNFVTDLYPKYTFTETNQFTGNVKMNLFFCEYTFNCVH